MKVVPRVAYPSWNFQETRFRDQDYAAHLFVHAVKNNRTKINARYAMLPVGIEGTRIRVDRNNVDVVRRYFGRWAAGIARERNITDPVFVAVPNSNGTADAADFNTAYLARVAAERFGEGARFYTGLRFIEYRPKDERDHRETSAELRANMTLIEPLPHGTLVLLDDVYTVGAHISAAARMMPDDRLPSLAIVAAHTVHEPQPDMFAVEPFNHWVF